MRTQPSEDGVGDATVHGEFNIRSVSYAVSDKWPFDASVDPADLPSLLVARNYIAIFSRSLQDIESSRSYIDELYSPDAQKCLEAIM